MAKAAHLMIGEQAEQAACDFLIDKKWRPLARNVRYRVGEIDLIFLDGHTVVFVEVRYRQDRGYGDGFDSITASKQQKIIRAAQTWLQQHPEMAGYDCRFDAIAVQGASGQLQCQWLASVFSAEGFV